MWNFLKPLKFDENALVRLELWTLVMVAHSRGLVGLVSKRLRFSKETLRKIASSLFCYYFVLSALIVKYSSIDWKSFRMRFELVDEARFRHLMSETLNEEIIEFKLGTSVFKEHISAIRFQSILKTILIANPDVPTNGDIVWNISVIESPQINAMSLPHGQLYLTDADSSLSDDEISLLIGHEMSHVINLHSLELIYIYAFSNLVASPLIFLLWGGSQSKYLSAAIHFMITSLISGFNNFESRHIELEADLQGMILAASACYNMSIGPRFWEEMGSQHGQSESLWFREAFMSHPSYSSRAKFAQDNINDIMEMRRARGCPDVPPLPPPKPKKRRKEKKPLSIFQYFVLLLKDSVFIMTAVFRSVLF